MRLLPRKYKTHNSIQVSRRQLLHNFDFLTKLSGLTPFPVLKSNAYGHGIAEVATILKDRSFPYIAVDGYFEALRVRKVSRQPVLIMGAIAPDNFAQLRYDHFAFLVSDQHTIKALAKVPRKIKLHLDVDTGMKRYGADPADLPKLLTLIQRFPNLELEGVATHLADADNPTSRFTARQVAVFDKAAEQVLAAGFKPRWFHLSNTPGLLKAASRHANSFRPGIGLYGINPLPRKDEDFKKLSGLRPALRLMSTITLIRMLNPGETVSYNRTFRAKRKMQLGVVPLGYYEGIPRSLSNKGAVFRGKRRLPVIGRICMNHFMIDLTGSRTNMGDEVVVISNDPKAENSIQRLSEDYYFFTYGLLAKLNSDIHREIVA